MAADGESAHEPISYSQLEAVPSADGVSHASLEAAIRLLEAELSGARGDEDRAQLSLELGLLHLEAGDLERAGERLGAAGGSAAAVRLRTELAIRRADPGALAAAVAAELALAEGNAARASLRVAQGRLEATDEGALAAFTEAAALESGVEACLAAERAFVRAGRDGEAGDVARVAAERLQSPEAKAEWLARAARYASRAGQPQDAAAALRRATELAPEAASVRLGWELLAARSRDPARWIELRSLALDRGADPADAIDAGILARYRLRDGAMARAFFDHAFERAEGDAKRFLAGELVTMVDPIEELPRWLELTEARRALTEDPEARAQLEHELARGFADLADDPERAREHALACLALAPAHAPALELLARLDRGVGPELAAAWRRAAEATDDPALRADALARVADADRESAPLAWVEAEAAAPGDLGALAGLERAFADPAAPERVQALERAAPSFQHPVSRLRSALSRADARVAAGDPEGARAILEEAAATDAQVSLALEAKRRLEPLLAPTERLAILCELLAADPWDALHRWTTLARELLESGDPDELAPALAEVLPEAPLRHPFRLVMRRLLAEQERPEELRDLHDASAALADGPARAAWLERAADVTLHELDQPVAALERLEAARALLPSASRLVTLSRDILARREDHPGLSRLPFAEDDAVACLQRAALHEAAGDLEAATRAYLRAEALGLEAAGRPAERLLAEAADWASLVSRAEGAAAPEARHRAAVLAAEELRDPDAARAILEGGDGLALLALRHRVDGDLAAVLGLAEGCDDPVLARALRREAAWLRTAADPDDAAAWLPIAEADPSDVLAAAHTTVSLARADRLKSLLEFWEASPPPIERSSLATLAAVRMAAAYEALGSLRAAADAAALAVERPEAPWLAHLQAPRLHRLLDDPEGRARSLAALARRLSRGPASARVWLTLAIEQREAGDRASALETLVRAHRAAPTYYPALHAIAAASPDHPGPLIDALMRVLEAETRPRERVIAGVRLGELLVESGRLELAREVLERVVATDPGSLPGQLWLAEVHERLEEPAGVLDALESVADHPELDEGARLRALTRQIDLALGELQSPSRARRAAMKLAAIDADHPKVLEATLAVAREEDDPRRMAGVLEKLVASERVGEGERVGHLFELATIEAERLGDVSAAIRALGSIRSPQATEETVRRLLTLGESSGRWDLASQALEAALDDATALDRDWELTIRRRLVAIFEGPLEDAEAAARQLRRIVALAPGDLAVLRKLSAASTDPAEHLSLRRMVFAADPDPEVLDALREGFAAIEDEDAVFLCEAVAVGMGWGTEEARYFYRQRRAFLPTPSPEHQLTDAQLESLLEAPSPVARGLLGALEPILHEVFPPDFTAYGVRVEAPPGELPEGAVAETAMLFGCAPPPVHEVGAQLGPTVEHHARGPVLLLPRTLIDAPQRQQRFALGCLFYRLSTRTTWSDPCRLEPLRSSFLGYLLTGLQRELRGEHEPVGRAILDDVQARLRDAMTDEVREAARAVEGWEGLDTASVDTEGLLRATALAAGRAGLVASQDPAAALEALGRWPQLLHVDGRGAGLHELMVGFALSDPHAELREALGLGLIR